MQRFAVGLAMIGISITITLGALTMARSDDKVYRIIRLGDQMSPQDKVALEERVAKQPDDIESRTRLLGYYSIKGRQDADARPAVERHIVWLIENAPESEVLGTPYGQIHKLRNPEGYVRAKDAWLKAIKTSPDNATLLWNSAQFFLLNDRQLAEKHLIRGQTVAADDPRWPAALGQLYSLGMQSLPTGPELTKTAETAFQHYQRAYELSNDMGKNAMSSRFARAALTAGRVEDARTLAEKMLEDDTGDWNLGNQIHHGNLILGQIALLNGDIDTAKSRLLLAGKTPGSPQLNSFGPNMLLAKELLERGEKAVVLEYFELCKKFWTSPRRGLDEWIKDVQSDRIPEFQANLSY